MNIIRFFLAVIVAMCIGICALMVSQLRLSQVVGDWFEESVVEASESEAR